MIIHEPLIDTSAICEHYAKKDGVEITYICTTDLRQSDNPVNVFFRETPHPDFGNRYFGMWYDHYRDSMFITNADVVEELEFGMVMDSNGDLHYSKSHHDMKYIAGEENLLNPQQSMFIDGGREYVRVGGNPLPEVHYYVVRDGNFVKI